MPDAPLPLNDLTQQIARRQAELEELRQEFEARQSQLAALHQQRQDLRAQLSQVEADIAAVTRGETGTMPVSATSSGSGATGKVPRGTFTDVLLEVVREAKGPLTARELAEELSRRQVPTSSGNLKNLVQTRLSELVKKGILRLSRGRKGVVLRKQRGGKKALPGKAAAPMTETPHLRNGQPSLRSVLTDLLAASKKPMAARDLAGKVLATGYETKSKNFTTVVWTALGNMDEAENVKGKGWRLKGA